ncbi:LysR family transcriptional regulator [Diaphorobacter sp. HDW4B]|uniref:LysR family transcriptional regulator n=1 Tax=Diaphorobacter sp. HDW4B TaxID=2714925 RepID=UPI00140A8617|nr:LysR family transcriptional regulator [Diaphorobacter sp. HDW4B]QIL70799.1 LysR family transcriptional regulator [Diaphorobacter sp. HDW4B]
MTDASQPGSDRLELMSSFIRIVEAGSLSAAAQQLGTSQPTMSRRLQTLERLLGTKLLQRSTHGMQLTEGGARCFENARQLVAQWHEMEADLRGPREQPRGNLRVMVPHAFGQDQLVAPLAAFLRSCPEVNVEWRLDDRSPNFVAEGVDCAIHVGPLEDITGQSVVTVPLAQVRRIAVAAPPLLADGRIDTRESPAQLEALPWLAISTFYRRELQFQRVDDANSKHTIQIAPRFITDNLYALRAAAIEGLGACVASAWLVHEDIQAGRLMALAPQWEVAPLPVSILYPYASFYPARLRRFVDAMKAALPHIPGMVGL